MTEIYIVLHMASLLTDSKSKFIVRRLNDSDLGQLETIIVSRCQMGIATITVAEARATFEKIKENVVIPNDRTIVWGSFDGDFLSAVLVQSIAELCKYDWLMSYLVVNHESKYPWNYSKNGLDEAWERAIEFAESTGRHVIRWSLPIVWARTQERTKKSSRIWKNYTIDTYSLVKAGTQPDNPFDCWVAGNIKPYDVILRRAVRSDKSNISVL